LLADKYGYRYGRHQVRAPAADAPVFACRANNATPLPKENLRVAWRMGLDLNPLDVTNDDDVRWLKALVWPGEGEREALPDQALAIARRHPPRVIKGDLRQDLASLAATAPKDASLVIFHSAVLNYVADPSERLAFAEIV